MYKNNRRGRLSPRELAEQINARHSFHAGAAPDPDKAAIGLDTFTRKLPPKRDKVVRPVDGRPVVPLEKDVLADALQALREDPRVAICDRRQSGVFQEGERYIRVGQRGHLDVSGMLHGGRYFEIEAKRPGEKPDERQRERIAHIQRAGGISGYFTSAAEALALLP